MSFQPFITMEDFTVRVGGRWILAHTNWQINHGEHWVIWGPNGAGKTTLAKTLLGQTAVVQGQIQRHYEEAVSDTSSKTAVAMVSPEQYHQLYQRAQLIHDMRHFSGQLDNGATTCELLDSDAIHRRALQPTPWRDYMQVLDVATLVAKPLEALSSGEMAKLLLARALASDPRMLVLDEPFNGLDQASQEDLVKVLTRLAQAGIQLVLITHRMAEVADCFTHVIQLDQGRVTWQGLKADFIHHAPAAPATSAEPNAPDRPTPAAQEPTEPAELIRMRQVTVRYGDATVLHEIDWTMRQGEHWALIGPNGAGKSTLLRLISGDNLQGYANELVLFGRRKGTGESVWQIRQQIGLIADDLQARYQRRLAGFDVICSGFFDSVGLYRRCTPEQRNLAHQWVERLDLQDLSAEPFHQLSFGRQRLVLIARAMVKSPRLLILDEPCNGLDQTQRTRLLALLDVIGRSRTTHLLYVSHRPDEMPACITHRLYLKAGRVVKQNQD